MYDSVSRRKKRRKIWFSKPNWCASVISECPVCKIWRCGRLSVDASVVVVWRRIRMVCASYPLVERLWMSCIPTSSTHSISLVRLPLWCWSTSTWKILSWLVRKSTRTYSSTQKLWSLRSTLTTTAPPTTLMSSMMSSVNGKWRKCWTRHLTNFARRWRRLHATSNFPWSSTVRI